MKTQVTVLLSLCTILAVCDTHNLCNAENEGRIIQTQVKICHKGKPQTLFKIRSDIGECNNGKQGFDHRVKVSQYRRRLFQACINNRLTGFSSADPFKSKRQQTHLAAFYWKYGARWQWY
ncbi:uncharacterized protein LOC130625576 [Hydractinia symbiolongicarpus]|uniref:uncharacterized protein LOC130625576 n=1 Tax=Hydractinia symbiolongicarpus TaxID=13093 RepID=UPI00254DDA40|nr:uncharacterized protein LOC130625576 [Hydractinia symbiolongicarpus]